MFFVEFFLNIVLKFIYLYKLNKNKNRIIYYIKWSNFFKWIVVYYNVYIKISFVVLKIVYFSEILIY